MGITVDCVYDFVSCANYQKDLNFGTGQKYAEVFFLLLPWEVRSVETQISKGLGNAVCCRRLSLLCGSDVTMTVMHGVSIWDDVPDAVMAMAGTCCLQRGQNFTCPPLVTA